MPRDTKTVFFALWLGILAGCSDSPSSNGIDSAASTDDSAGYTDGIDSSGPDATATGSSSSANGGDGGAANGATDEGTTDPDPPDTDTAGNANADEDATAGNEGEGLEPDANDPGQPATEATDSELDDSSVTPLARLIAQITRAAGRPIVDLNRRLREGQSLNEQESRCLGSYESGLGQPLLRIECPQELATGNVAIYTAVAQFDATDACAQALNDNTLTGCTLDQARLLVPDQWPRPPDGQRPRLVAGADIDYRTEGEQLRLASRPNSATGNFLCELSLSADEASTASVSPGVNCDDTVLQVEQLLRELMDNETPVER